MYAESLKMPSQRDEEIFRQSLNQIGLTPNEAVLYRTSLELGPRPASVLAKTAGMNRTRAYDLLFSLERRGLVETSERNHIRYYSPTSPSRVAELLRLRQREVESNAKEFEDILPKLSSPVGDLFSEQLAAHTVKGVRQMKDLFMEFLEDEPKMLSSIGDVEKAIRQHQLFNRFASQFRSMRIEKGIKLLIAESGSPDIFVEDQLLRETVYSPEVPDEVLLLVNDSRFMIIELGNSPRVSLVANKLLANILSGLHRAWEYAVRKGAE